MLSVCFSTSINGTDCMQDGKLVGNRGSHHRTLRRTQIRQSRALNSSTQLLEQGNPRLPSFPLLQDPTQKAGSLSGLWLSCIDPFLVLTKHASKSEGD